MQKAALTKILAILRLAQQNFYENEVPKAKMGQKAIQNGSEPIIYGFGGGPTLQNAIFTYDTYLTR